MDEFAEQAILSSADKKKENIALLLAHILMMSNWAGVARSYSSCAKRVYTIAVVVIQQLSG